MEDLPKLLNKNYQKFTSQYEVDEYIRQLRKSCKDLKLQNDFLLKEECYLPITVPVNYPFDHSTKVFYETMEEPNRDFIAITVTFDQKKHPQLIITPYWEQQKYIEKVFSILLYEQHITAVYGCFEKQKNGFIHGHFIVPHYGDYHNLQDIITSYFTSRKSDKQHAVLIKPVTDIRKWLDYINKTENYKDFMEYNIKKKSLDL